MDHTSENGKKRSFFRQEKDGGIVAVCCGPNGKRLIRAVPSIRAFQNWFASHRQKMIVPDELLAADWNQFGASSFYTEVLETVPRKDDQTDDEYASVLRERLQNVQSRLENDLLYRAAGVNE